jgi:hypothetical protein
VPGAIDDPYTPPPAGSGTPVATYRRADRTDLGPRSDALPDPDFSGSWSTAVLSSTPPTGQVGSGAVPTLGSGWGDRISITHDADRLEVERVVFVPREVQPLIRYRYALDGSTAENAVSTGRDGPAPTSTTRWDGNRLVITTTHRFRNPADGSWATSEVVRTLWLQPANDVPFEPSLVVETTRGSALGGPASVDRSVYTRGYR